MRELVIKPIGGLGNRLLVIDSVIKLHEMLNPDNTIIIWEKNRNLNCSFQMLFHYPDQLHFVETTGFNKYLIRSYFEFYNSFHPSNFRWPLINKFLGKERKCETVMYAEEMDKKLKDDIDYFPDTDTKSLYISFYKRFGPKVKGICNFTPVKELFFQVDDIVKNFRENTIGVHIRRTDHALAVRHSPTGRFMEAMEKKIKYDDATFFLSTDSERERDAILKRFGKRVITRERNLNRNSPKGIQEAVIDLFCLSRTSEIIGSYRSTFGQVAAEIGGIENNEIFVR